MIKEINYNTNEIKYSENIKMTLLQQVANYKAEGFYIYKVFSDNEKAITSIEYDIKNIEGKLITGGIKSM